MNKMRLNACGPNTLGGKKAASPGLSLDLSIFMGFRSRGLEQISALSTFVAELRSYRPEKPIA
jgi:hypothetical protein